MTFEEANAIVKSIDDYQKYKEATEAFGIKYVPLPVCKICGHRGICHFTNPLVYKCNFLAPREDINYPMKGLDLMKEK